MKNTRKSLRNWISNEKLAQRTLSHQDTRTVVGGVRKKEMPKANGNGLACAPGLAVSRTL